MKKLSKDQLNSVKGGGKKDTPEATAQKLKPIVVKDKRIKLWKV